MQELGAAFRSLEIIIKPHSPEPSEQVRLVGKTKYTFSKGKTSKAHSFTVLPPQDQGWRALSPDVKPITSERSQTTHKAVAAAQKILHCCIFTEIPDNKKRRLFGEFTS
jgi:hypothetical protein